VSAKWAYALAIVISVGIVIFYVMDPTVTTSVVSFSLRYAVPLILAAMVGIMCERSGVINIGIEGQMLMSAFTWKMDQIIAGTIINILAAGLTSFFYAQGFTLPGVTPTVRIPILADIPLIGPVFFDNGIFTYAAIVSALLLWVLLFKTVWGLRTRSVGEKPSASDTSGIGVQKTRFWNVTIAGGLAGLAGAYLALEAAGTFERGLTAGRGFTALAIMIFGAWNPIGALAAAIFFGLTQGVASQLQTDAVVEIPPQFVNMLPYILTIVLLAIVSGRIKPPAAVGRPYEKD